MAESLLNTPVLWINQYLQSKLGADTGIGVPFFPTNPSTIEQLTQSFIVTAENVQVPTAGIMAVWDRMFRMRRSRFPHIKEEQLLYYFYATESDVTPLMVQVQEQVLRLLDREDESAQEINDWLKDRTVTIGTETLSNKFFFHSFKVYQLEEARDIVDFGTARTYGGNKIIIDYKYHQDNAILNPPIV